MTAGVRYGIGVLLTALGLVVATAGLVAMVTPGLGPEPQAVEPIDLDETDGPTATTSPSDAPRSGADERGAVAIGPPGGAEDPPPDTESTRERDTADAERRTGVAPLDVVAAGSTPAPGGQDGAEPVDTPAVADVPSPDPSPDVPSPEPTPEVPSPEPAPVPAPDPTPQEPAPSPDPGVDPDLDPVAWRDDDRDDVPSDDADPEPDDDGDDSRDSDHSRDDSHDSSDDDSTDDSHDEGGPPGHSRHDPAGDHDSRHARSHDNH